MASLLSWAHCIDEWVRQKREKLLRARAIEVLLATIIIASLALFFGPDQARIPLDIQRKKGIIDAIKEQILAHIQAVVDKSEKSILKFHSFYLKEIN